ncbi:tetratricopeptide repeat protein [Pendulispora albinea]|uniref:Tetratricopeptide repeat protein n=1 Tax=Pendulispora albinea TaxID=2741071 RepID=A0ABZ2LVD9_9BACT
MRFSLRPLALTILLASTVGVPAFAQQPPAQTSDPAPGPSPGAPPASPSTGSPVGGSSLTTSSLTIYPECKNNPTEAESEAAHGAYLAGKGSFDEADYVTAVTYFKDAYRRDCTKHELLNALSRAYELKGDRAEAINALETYLRRVPPNAPGNDAIQRRLVALKAQSTTASTPPPTPVPAGPASTVSPATTPPAPSDPVPDRPASTHTVYPWIVAGGGVVLIAAGVSVWAIGTSQINASKDDAKAAKCDGTRCPEGVDVKPFQDKNDSGATKRGIGFTLMGVGAAAVAGGIVWHFLEPKLSPSRRVQARPDLGPGYAGLSLGGSF